MASTLDWSDLAHAYGDASDMPALVAALASDDDEERGQAILDIEARVAHQGTVYSASAPVLPLLIDRISLVTAHDRPAIARLVGLVAWGRGEKKATEAAVSKALAALVPRLLPLLDDRDPEVRLALVNTFSKVAALDPAVPKAIADRLAIEPDPAVLFGLAWAPHFGKCKAPVWLSACEALLDASDPIRRLAGATALVVARRGEAPDAAVAPLLEALATPAPFEAAFRRMTWSQGIDVDLANLASFLGDDRWATVLPALAARMELSSEAPSVAEALLFMAFRKSGAPERADALDDVRRAVLLRLYRCDGAWNDRTEEVLGLGGLPGSRDDLGLWLGEKSRRILAREVTIEGQTTPLHVHAEAHFAAGKSVESWFATIGDAVSPVEVLEVLVEIWDGAFKLNRRRENDERADVSTAWEVLLPSSAARDAAGVAAWARRYLDAQLNANPPSEEHHRMRRFEALAAAEPGPLDARFDAIVPGIDCDVAVHGRIPQDRLERIVLADLRRRALDLGEPERGAWGIGFAGVAEASVAFLALCPTRRLAQALLGLAALSGVGVDVVEDVVSYAEEPGVAAALADLEEREESATSYLTMRRALEGFVDEVYPPLPPDPSAQGVKKPAKPAAKKTPAKALAAKKKPVTKKAVAKKKAAKAASAKKKSTRAKAR